MITLGEGLAIGGFMLNAGAIVWAAAKVTSTVDYLKITVTELKGIVMDIQQQTHNAKGRLTILEYVTKVRPLSDDSPIA